MLSLLVLMALTVYVTIGSKGDEKSTYGYTVYEGGYAVTHINQMDVNVKTPVGYSRYFPDSLNTYIVSEMKSNNLAFLSHAPDYSVIQAFMIVPGITGISDEKAEQMIRETQGVYSITSDLSHEKLSLGGLDFLRVCYNRKDREYLDYGVAAEYFTVHNDMCLQLRCFVDFEKEPNYAEAMEELCGDVEEYLAGYSYGATESKPAEGNYLWERWKSLDFAPWVLLIPLFYVILCGITYTGRSEKVYVPEKKRYRFVGDVGTGWNEEFLSQPVSKMLLGPCAVFVVLHHLVQRAGGANVGILAVLEDFGVGFVGVFFFFSGFGLFESVCHKEGYLKDFLKKRLPVVLVPAYNVILIFVVYELFRSKRIDAKQTIAWLTGWKLINPQMWYIVEIVFLYLIFYMIFRFIKNRGIGIALLFVLSGLMIAISLSLCHGDSWFQGEWWYNTTLLFPIGVLFSAQRENLVYYMKRFYAILLPLTVVLFCVFYKLTRHALLTYSYWSERGTDKGYDDKLRCLLVQCPMVFFFVMLLLMLGLKLKIGNRALVFLGKVSLELYLIHNLFINIFSTVKGTGAFFTSVLATSLLAAFLLHELHARMLCLIYKKPLLRMHPVKRFKAYGVRKKAELHEFMLRAKRSFSYGIRNKKTVGVLLLRHGFCIFLCAVSLFPVVLLAVNSTKTRAEMVRGISLLPGGKFAENFMEVRTYLGSLGLDLYRVVGLSCAISFSCTFLGTYIGGMCAYGFEFFSFKRKKSLWWVVLAALMMPASAGCVGFLKLVSMMHMYNSLFPIIMAGITIPACVYFLRMYLHTLSLIDIIEAARIDGCREFWIFNKIILPIIKPAILLQLIINFANSWNNTIYQNLVLINVKKKSISVFLKTLSIGKGSGFDPMVYCTLLVSTIPTLVLYILFSHGIAARINLGGIKE